MGWQQRSYAHIIIFIHNNMYIIRPGQSSETARDVVPPPRNITPRQRGLKSHARFVFVTRGGIARIYAVAPPPAWGVDQWRRRRYAHLQTREAARSARCQTTPFCFYIKISTLTQDRKKYSCVCVESSNCYFTPLPVVCVHYPQLCFNNDFRRRIYYYYYYYIIVLRILHPPEGIRACYISICIYILLLTEGTRLFAPLLYVHSLYIIVYIMRTIKVV